VIDFRYHLVSLISVFLALAVGIILGAGPLQGAIGATLTDQVDSLRVERNELRTQLSDSQADAAERLQFIQAAGPALVEDTLDGVKVAVVELDDVDPDVQKSMAEAVEGAGGTVSATVALNPSWTDEDHAGLRDTIAGGMRERLVALDVGLTDESSTDELLAAALAVALGGTDANGVRSEDSLAFERQLDQADLVTVTGTVSESADVVLLLSATRGDAQSSSATPAPDEQGRTSLAELARTIQPLTPAVVAGPTAGSGDVVSTIRGNGELAAEVSTVSGFETQIGRIVVPLALAAHLDGVVGQYGFEDGATVLPPIIRQTPPPPPADDPTGQPTGEPTTPDEGS
jgi:hypothetical protein